MPPCWPKPPPCAVRPRKPSRAWALPGPALLNRCCVAASRYCTPLRCSGLCCHLPLPLPRPPCPPAPWLRCSTRFRAESELLTLLVKLFALLLLTETSPPPEFQSQSPHSAAPTAMPAPNIIAPAAK